RPSGAARIRHICTCTCTCRPRTEPLALGRCLHAGLLSPHTPAYTKIHAISVGYRSECIVSGSRLSALHQPTVSASALAHGCPLACEGTTKRNESGIHHNWARR